MLHSFISVKEASERYGYSDSHIRNLLGKGVIEGEKFASVWLVDATSVEEYKRRMEELGKKKHGVWAISSDGDGPASSDGRGDGTVYS